MATWNLGACFACFACFACTRCSSRSVWPTCQRCRKPSLDLRNGLLDLEAQWSAFPAFAKGRTLSSPRSIASRPSELRSRPSWVPLQKSGHAPEPLEFVLALGVGLFLSPFGHPHA